MTDMERLIEAVEAGNDDEVNERLRHMASASRDVGNHWPIHDARAAYRGSLDAALALHDALLPGWEWNIDAGDGAYVENRGDFGSPINGDIADKPARAWLLAILRAKAAQK